MTAIASATQVATGTPTADPRAQRLHTAANQFEAMLLQEMMKPLAAKPEENGLSADEDAQSGPLQGFGVQAVAESLARSGALGFAKQIEGALKAHAGANAALQKS